MLTKEQIEGIKNRLDEANRGKSSGWLCVLYDDLSDVCEVALNAEAEITKLKAERDNLQMTLRSLKMRGEDND